MSTNKQTIYTVTEFHKLLNQKYKNENIVCLSDWNEVLFDNKNALAFFIDTTAEIKKKLNIDQYELDMLLTELIYSTSGMIKSCIGNMLIYKDCGLNDWNKEKVDFNNHKITTYDMKLQESEYLSFASIGFEKLYNFWDRIGDLLNLCLSLQIPGNDVYFVKAIDKANKIESYAKSKYFIELSKYRSREYKVLNKKRKKVVHHNHIDSYFYVGWQKYRDDCSKMSQLQKEKEDLLGELITYNQHTIKGFENACRLIGEQK